MKASKALLLPKQAVQQFFDLLYPPHCAGCQRSGYVLCAACLAQICLPSAPACQRCSAPLSPGGVCFSCQSAPLKLSGLRAVSVYQGPLRLCIHALKYDGNTRLAQPLGMLLAQTYLALRLRADAIVSVPLHSERYRQRGSNHAALLAQVCAAQIGLPLFES